MRVSNMMNAAVHLRTLENRSEAYARAQRALSTGIRVSRPSDDPSDTARIMRLRSSIERNLQFQRNVNSARIRVAQVDAGLQRVEDIYARGRALAVQGAQDTLAEEERHMLATELDQLLEMTIAEGNRRFLGRSLFSGSNVDQDPFIALRNEEGRITRVLSNPEGTSGEIMARISEEEEVLVSFDGAEVFMGGAPEAEADIFSTLIRLRDGLLDNDSEAAETAIERIDQAQFNLGRGLAAAGSRMRRIMDVEDRLFVRETWETERLSELEDMDMAEAAMDFALQEVGYQAALFSISRVMSRSLMEFLG